MAKRYIVLVADKEAEGSTIDGPFPTEHAALSFAESRAEQFYGGDDVTWFKSVGAGEYVVGRITEDGSRSEPLVRITVEEDEFEVEEDPMI